MLERLDLDSLGGKNFFFFFKALVFFLEKLIINIGIVLNVIEKVYI